MPYLGVHQHYGDTMARRATILLLFLLGTACLPAWSQEGPPSSEVLQSCLLGTTEETWKKLALTRDQLVRIGRIQDACREECDVPGVIKTDNPISNSDGNTIMDEVRNVLSADQYRDWVAYCMAVGGVDP